MYSGSLEDNEGLCQCKIPDSIPASYPDRIYSCRKCKKEIK